MNQYDVAGVLQTYAEKARRARDKKHLKEIIRNLNEEFDLRRLTVTKQD